MPDRDPKPCAVCGLLVASGDPLCPNCQKFVPPSIQRRATLTDEEWSKEPHEHASRVFLARFRILQRDGALIPVTATDEQIQATFFRFAGTGASIDERDLALRRYAEGRLPAGDEPRWVGSLGPVDEDPEADDDEASVRRARKDVSAWFARTFGPPCDGAGPTCPGSPPHSATCRSRRSRALQR